MGFGIGAIMKGTSFEGLYLTPGRYYVDGLGIETGADDDERLTQPVAFADQPFRQFDIDDDPLPEATPYLVYLRVFERLVTAVEDPSIRDPALGAGGPDSAARAQAVWQAFAVPFDGDAPPNRAKALEAWAESILPGLVVTDLGRLAAKAADPPTTEPLCALAPSSRYRGTGNQLYRVEVHRAGSTTSDGDPPTFKWSRDNGAVTFAIEDLDEKTVIVENLGRDDRYGLSIGDWVEVVDDLWAVEQRYGRLFQVTEIDPLERRVELDEPVPSDVGHDPTLHRFLRRWDQQDRPDAPLADDGGVRIAAGEPIELEDGVLVYFGEGTYRTGDYWVIPARTSTGDVDAPREDNGDPIPRLPYGIRYSFAPLAMVGAVKPVEITDLRCAFAPIACDVPDPAPPPWERGEPVAKKAAAPRRRRARR